MGRKAELTPRKKPRQSRSRFTVEQILEASAQVFAEQGYAGATTNHIAERAGVSVGSLYQYFPNKDAILVALVERHVRQEMAMLEEMFTQAERDQWSFDEMLERFVRATVGFHTAAPRLQHVLLYEAPRPPEVMALFHEIEETIATVVSAVLTERLGTPARHASHVAYLVVHVVEALAHEFVIHPPADLDEEAFLAELCCLLRSYLMTPCPTS